MLDIVDRGQNMAPSIVLFKDYMIKNRMGTGSVPDCH